MPRCTAFKVMIVFMVLFWGRQRNLPESLNRHEAIALGNPFPSAKKGTGETSFHMPGRSRSSLFFRPRKPAGCVQDQDHPVRALADAGFKVSG